MSDYSSDLSMFYELSLFLTHISLGINGVSERPLLLHNLYHGPKTTSVRRLTQMLFIFFSKCVKVAGCILDAINPC